jgi:peptidoglycan/LPS O-acetylase OafA/YrhL
MKDDKSLVWIAAGYSMVLLLIMGGVAYYLWDKPDPQIWYVPVPILMWAFIGGMVGVLYQLAFGQGLNPRFYTWLVAKPVVGLVMGAIVYFLAVGGELTLNGKTQIENIQILSVLAFLGGFSDRYSVGLLDRITGRSAIRKEHRKDTT